MVKYVMVATALKLFSSSSPMKKLYRRLGNTFGSKRRVNSNIPPYYIERVKRMLNLCERFNVIKNDDKVLELGTGWVHWEATTMRLLFDIEAVLFDVWDNRQFEAFKKYFAEFDKLIGREIDIDPVKNRRIHNLIKVISSTSSFDDFYDAFGFKYIIEPSGKLDRIKNESFDVIVSAGVLEHIEKGQLSEYIREFYRLLKPGGYCVHSINIADHLYAYDKSVSIKNYLKYSDKIWRFCFENEVQYFNRVQKSEWLALFNRAGLKLIDEESTCSNIGSIEINQKYRELQRQDLECISLKIVHRKPPFS